MLIETVVIRPEGAKLQVLIIEGRSLLWSSLWMWSKEGLYGFGAVSKGKLLHYPIIIYYGKTCSIKKEDRHAHAFMLSIYRISFYQSLEYSPSPAETDSLSVGREEGGCLSGRGLDAMTSISANFLYSFLAGCKTLIAFTSWSSSLN